MKIFRITHNPRKREITYAKLINGVQKIYQINLILNSDI